MPHKRGLAAVGDAFLGGEGWLVMNIKGGASVTIAALFFAIAATIAAGVLAWVFAAATAVGTEPIGCATVRTRAGGGGEKRSALVDATLIMTKNSYASEHLTNCVWKGNGNGT